MTKIKTATFVFFTLFILLFPLIVYPVVADKITVNQGYYRFPYGNGIDDDYDGVVDNPGERDVFNGTRNISASANVILDTWTNDFSYPENGIPKGVCIGGVFEELWYINSSLNHLVTPAQTAKYLDLDYVGNMSFSDKTNMLNVVMFYVNITPQILMNGASQLWYRSPLAWDNTTYQGTQHYLNIYDDTDTLVYASTDSDAGGAGFVSCIPTPKILVDESGNFSNTEITNMSNLSRRDGGYYAPHENIGGRNYWNRSYFQLNMNFRTGMRYRFEEYIETKSDVPINNVTLFMARSQDIAGDNETTTYIFWGTPYAKNIPVECSWGIVASVGKGRVGSELLMMSSDKYAGILDHPTIFTHRFSGDPTVLNTASILVVLPIRTSKPLNISIACQYWSGAALQTWFSPMMILTGVTGTIVFSMDLPPDVDPTEPNDYQLSFTILNFDAFGDAIAVSVFPAIDSVTGDTETSMIQYGFFGQTEIYYFAMDVQLREETVATGTVNQGTDALEFILGAALIISALILAFTIIGAPVSVTIITGALSIGTFSAITTVASISSIALGTLGTLLIMHSFTGEGIDHFVSWAAQGIIRILTSIYEGIRYYFGSVWDFAVAIYEVVKFIGNFLAEYGSVILAAILQIIWFIAFIIVLMLWSAFLVSMKYIAKGDVDGALRALFRPVKKPLVLLEKKSYKSYKSGKKWYNKIQRESTRKERELKRGETYSSKPSRYHSISNR